MRMTRFVLAGALLVARLRHAGERPRDLTDFCRICFAGKNRTCDEQGTREYKPCHPHFFDSPHNPDSGWFFFIHSE